MRDRIACFGRLLDETFSPAIRTCARSASAGLPPRSISRRSRDSAENFPVGCRTGLEVCLRARDHGLLLRPLGDSLLLVPPLCLDESELGELGRPHRAALDDVLRLTFPTLSPMTNLDLPHPREIYDLPLPELMFRAQETHRRHHDPAAVQLCTLQSIKTGRCPEDCKYCPQSAHYNTGLEAEPLMDADADRGRRRARRRPAGRRASAWARPGARCATAPSSTRCWPPVRGVSELGLEVCCTLGMLDRLAGRAPEGGGLHGLQPQSRHLARVLPRDHHHPHLRRPAGDAGRASARPACRCAAAASSGMGESVDDRLKLLGELAEPRSPARLRADQRAGAGGGHAAGGAAPVEPFEFVRIIATARILMPRAMVRLSAGRTAMSDEVQALCFLAGANSIFLGDKLLTTPNPERSDDMRLAGAAGAAPAGRRAATGGIRRTAVPAGA